MARTSASTMPLRFSKPLSSWRGTPMRSARRSVTAPFSQPCGRTRSGRLNFNNSRSGYHDSAQVRLGGSTLAGRRLALLIATDTYQDAAFSQLRAPAADVGALQAVLTDPAIGDYTVQLLSNARSHQ